MPGANQSAERRWGGWSSWLARRRVRIALGLLTLAVVVRVALPPVLRRVIVSQANAALGEFGPHGLRVIAYSRAVRFGTLGVCAQR